MSSGLSRAQELYLALVLHHHVAEAFGGLRHGVRQGVYLKIVEPGAAHLASFDEPLDGTYIISHTPVYQLLSRSRISAGRVADVIIAYLETAKCFDRHRFDELASESFNELPSRDRTDVDPEQIDGFEGIYVHEGNAAFETLISSAILSRRSGTSLSVALFDRIYRRSLGRNPGRPRELGQAYQKRIDRAAHDEASDFIGSVWSNGGVSVIELRPTLNDDWTRSRRHGTLTSSQSDSQRSISVTLFDDGVERMYQDHMTLIGGEQKIPVNLTERYRSHIIYRSRFLNTEYFFEIEGMKIDLFNKEADPVADLDRRLLSAAEQGDAIEMIEAIISGADINARDNSSGQTVLHHAAKSLAPPALAVLIPNHDMLGALYEHMADEIEDFDQADVDFKLRTQQQKLNPLALDRDYQFASEMINVPWIWQETRDDPVSQMKQWLFFVVSGVEQKALDAAGLDPALNRYGISHRKQVISSLSEDAPPSPPSPPTPEQS